MEFRFTPEEEVFRQEVRQFISEELPQTWQGYWEVPSDEQWDFYQSFVRKVAGKGWRTMDWPTEYGGQSTSSWRKVIFTEEMAYHRAPMQDNMALYIGRILMQFGT
ncbi:MAG: acyl-CoA dehydrogenase family protein, partial [Desulfatiglandales bacterium]|nr:acyl-CoA dehydrogenase family protein [Desulfatiglandales bacterium]